MESINTGPATVSLAPINGKASLLSDLSQQFISVRGQTEQLCSPLEPEDYGLQSMPDASPPKWHLAHSTWFFETFLLTPYVPGYKPFNPAFSYLFNSYYEAVGQRWPRPQRGLLSRPSVAEVYRYRSYVDSQMLSWLAEAKPENLREVQSTLILGLNHEQQHQELLLTDLKNAFALNPMRPVYKEMPSEQATSTSPPPWLRFSAGLYQIGHDGEGFAFDNELPRHRVYVNDFRLASQLVTNGDYMRFMEDDGYSRPEYWLSDGWNACRSHGWTSPLYWEKGANSWQTMTLSGLREVDEHEPVCHVSYYEAEAFVRWANARLPTEAEWEIASNDHPIQGNLLESGHLHPRVAHNGGSSHGIVQLYGDVWEWTASPYTAYPGYRPADGALGEYNGKFMCNQMVLRGGSCVTPASHIRPTYRNFFPPEARWQFTGIRLAQDL
jgi:ergothioneine biosynthesis protein EgtB